jgi:hypothetical protein
LTRLLRQKEADAEERAGRGRAAENGGEALNRRGHRDTAEPNCEACAPQACAPAPTDGVTTAFKDLDLVQDDAMTRPIRRRWDSARSF